MARRGQKPGDWLMTSDYTGFTHYASEMREDYWGNYARNPLKRNLQEIAVGLNDPEPVSIFRGPNYQITNGCIAEIAPPTVGDTSVPTNPNNMAFQVLGLSPAIPDMEIGCTFTVR